jgi:hypothetical protein
MPRRWQLGPIAVVIIVIAPGTSNHLNADDTRHSGFRLADAPEATYSPDPNDCWNRIFYFLFSRKFDALLSSQFPEGAPFRALEGMPGALNNLQVSTRTFERTETGDRPIDPLYPSFFTDLGARPILNDPGYADLHKALEQAIAENRPRSVMARAIMQNDLWSAYDILYRYTKRGEPSLAARRDELLRLFGRMIRKIALTPGEIHSLPENYQAARQQNTLPDLFGKDSGWLELQWFRRRMHDESVDNRRAVRIFVKPLMPPQNTQKFLNRFRRQYEDHTAYLQGVALVTQLLVIDSLGHIEPTAITTEVQIRRFHDDHGATLPRTEIEVSEIRRKKIVSEPDSGGLVPQREDDPVYASTAGNDYTFLSRQSLKREWGPPVVVKLRTRCVLCHGSDDLKNLMTFGLIVFPHMHIPPVQELDRRTHQAAEFVAERKMKAENWAALRMNFDSAAEPVSPGTPP